MTHGEMGPQEPTTEERLALMQEQIDRMQQAMLTAAESLKSGAIDETTAKNIGEMLVAQAGGQSETGEPVQEEPTVEQPTVERTQPDTNERGRFGRAFDSAKNRARNSNIGRKVGVALAIGAVAAASVYGISKIGGGSNESASQGSVPTASTPEKSNQEREKEQPTAEERREQREEAITKKYGVNPDELTKVKSVGTVMNKAKVNTPQKRSFILKNAMGQHMTGELNNTNNKMNGVNAEKVNTKDELMVAAGLAMGLDSTEGNQYGKGAVNFNTKFDRDINASTGMTAKQQEAFNKRFMTHPDGSTKLIKNYKGWVENGYMQDGGEMNAEREYFDGETVMVRTVPGMGTLMWKVTKDKDGLRCLNLVRKTEAPAPTPTTTTTSTPNRITTTTSTPTPRTTTTTTNRDTPTTRTTTTTSSTSTSTGSTVRPQPTKDHDKDPADSPIGDGRQPTEPNIPTPPVAPQPEGTGPDTYVPPATLPPEQDPIVPGNVEPTPATGGTNDGVVTGP